MDLEQNAEPAATPSFGHTALPGASDGAVTRICSGNTCPVARASILSWVADSSDLWRREARSATDPGLSWSPADASPGTASQGASSGRSFRRSNPEQDGQSTTSEGAGAKSFLERTQSTSVLWAAQLGRSLSGTLGRRAVHLSAQSVVPTQRCNVCLESVPSASCLVPKACGRQAHSTCAQCMTMYVKMRIEEGRVSELWCPCAGTDGCEAKVAECEVEAWTSSSVADKYRRFTRMQADSSLRACPKCNELCKPVLRKPGEAGSGIVPEMRCSACGCDFCFYHSNAHERGAKACAAYEREILKQERQALAKINTHKCPQCGVLTEKTSGCNHMTCPCKCQWCWVCGKEITNVGWHYHPLRPFSCAQYNEKTVQGDHFRLTALMTCTKILTWPSAVASACFILVCPFAFAAAILAQLVPWCATCCCCCFLCIYLKRLEANKFCCREWDVEDNVRVILSIALGVTFLLVGVPFLIFCLLWCLLAFPLWLILLLPLGAGSEHLMILASAPIMTVLASVECFAPDLERLAPVV